MNDYCYGNKGLRFIPAVAACIFLGVTAGAAAAGWRPALIMLAALLCCALIFLLRARYDLIAFMDICLMSVVLIEPAPSDLLFIGLAGFYFIGRSIDTGKIRRQSFILFLFCTYLAVSLIGIFNAVEIYTAVKFFILTLYLFMFCFFIFLYSSPHNHAFLIRAYIISSLIAAVLGLIGCAGYFQPVLVMHIYRAKALFKDPNVFGPYLVPAIIFLMDDLKARKIIKGGTAVHICMIILITVAVAFSFSRAAWINLGVAVAIYVFLNIGRFNVSKIGIYAGLLLVLAFVAWNCVSNTVLKDFFYERGRMQEYDRERFAAQNAGLILSCENPIGYGPGQYERVVTRIIPGKIAAHSLYMRVAVENGIAGFALFAMALACIAVNLVCTHLKGHPNAILKCSVLTSILAGIMVNSLVVDTLHWRHFWFFIGLSLSAMTGEPGRIAHSFKNVKGDGLYENPGYR